MRWPGCTYAGPPPSRAFPVALVCSMAVAINSARALVRSGRDGSFGEALAGILALIASLRCRPSPLGSGGVPSVSP
eukprot:279288-Alexandrium_andersonii.AAC.1